MCPAVCQYGCWNLRKGAFSLLWYTCGAKVRHRVRATLLRDSAAASPMWPVGRGEQHKLQKVGAYNASILTSDADCRSKLAMSVHELSIGQVEPVRNSPVGSITCLPSEIRTAPPNVMVGMWITWHVDTFPRQQDVGKESAIFH